MCNVQYTEASFEAPFFMFHQDTYVNILINSKKVLVSFFIFSKIMITHLCQRFDYIKGGHPKFSQEGCRGDFGTQEGCNHCIDLKWMKINIEIVIKIMHKKVHK